MLSTDSIDTSSRRLKCVEMKAGYAWPYVNDCEKARCVSAVLHAIVCFFSDNFYSLIWFYLHNMQIIWGFT